MRLASGERVVVYAGKELDYRVFSMETPQIIQADEKTIYFSIDEVINNPVNSNHKQPIDTCISENS